VFEEGKIKDSKARTVDFRNCYIIMTSNIGSSILAKDSTVGFGASFQDIKVETESKIKKELTKHMAPELINRIDDIVVFNSLDKKALYKICKLELNKLKKILRKQIKVKLTYSTEAAECIVNECYEEKYGARPIKRYLHKTVMNHISDNYLNNTDIKHIDLQVKDDKLEYIPI
jgi:ATP-dependent Clp protease ATP-binding subunit ClpC